MNLTSLLEFLGLQPSLKSANAMDGQARSTDGSTFDALLALEAGPDVMEPVSAPVNDALRAPVQGNLSALMHPGQTAALSIDQADVRHSGIDLPASESMPGKGLPQGSPQGSLQGSSLIKPIPVDQDQSHRAVAEIGLEPDLVMADPRATQQAVESQKADIPVSGAPETIPGQNAYNLPVGESAPPAGSAREPSLGAGDRLRADLVSEPIRARVASSDRWSETRPPLSSATPGQGPMGGGDADSEHTPLASREPSYRSPDGVPAPPAGIGARRNTLGRPSVMPAGTPAVAEHADDIALEARPKRSAVDAILQTQQQSAVAPRAAQGPASPSDARAYQGRAGMEPAISGVVSEITAEPHKGTVDAGRAGSTSSLESAPSAVSARAVAETVPVNRSESVAEIRSGSVVQLPEMARDNVDSIANRLAQRVSMLHATRGDQATVMLEPLDLGRIEVKVRMQADTTHLSFAVQHAPVRDVVETHMARLRTMLEDAGLNLGDVDVGDLAQGHPESEARYPAPSVPRFESDADISGSEGEVSSTAPVASNSLIDVHA